MKKPKRTNRNKYKFKFRCMCCNKLSLRTVGIPTEFHPYGPEYDWVLVCRRCHKLLFSAIDSVYAIGRRKYEKAR